MNSAVWVSYVGLIGDPREPNSNSLLVCVRGLEEGARCIVHPGSLAVVLMADERLMAI